RSGSLGGDRGEEEDEEEGGKGRTRAAFSITRNKVRDGENGNNFTDKEESE
ncbi:hypothetical protein RUM43_011102, partial [Polyplax serrata]